MREEITDVHNRHLAGGQPHSERRGITSGGNLVDGTSQNPLGADGETLQLATSVLIDSTDRYHESVLRGG